MSTMVAYYYDSKGDSNITAKKDMEALSKKFEVKFGVTDPVEDWFLSSNRISPALGLCSVRCTSYIDQMVARYLDSDIGPSKKYPAAWSYAPADETLVKAHEAACAVRVPATKELTSR